MCTINTWWVQYEHDDTAQHTLQDNTQIRVHNVYNIHQGGIYDKRFTNHTAVEAATLSHHSEQYVQQYSL